MVSDYFHSFGGIYVNSESLPLSARLVAQTIVQSNLKMLLSAHFPRKSPPLSHFYSLREQNMFIRAHLPIPARLSSLTALFSLLGVICLVLIVATPTVAQTPSLSVSDVTVNEGDPGFFNQGRVFVTLSAPSTQTVRVTVSTQADTATDNVDYVGGSIVLTIPPGGTSAFVDIATKGDNLVEGTEDFFLNLSNPENATIARGQGVFTIIDDDALFLLTEPNVQRGAALDSVTFVRDPLPITETINFSSDQRTRIIVFGVGLKLAAGENASAVTATAEDSVGTVRPLTVEFVAKVPTTDWLWQVILKLNDQITPPGDIKVRITVHGVTSNFVLVGLK
jgi:hypothetical protein